MLIEKRCLQNDECVFMEFRDVNKEYLEWLEDLALEYHCKIEKKEWRSKYNNYVVYDYEPFCSDGFEISLTLSSKSVCFLNFIRYLYEIKVQSIHYLNNCIAI